MLTSSDTWFWFHLVGHQDGAGMWGIRLQEMPETEAGDAEWLDGLFPY